MKSQSVNTKTKSVKTQPKTKVPYVLGTSRDELERLEIQHRVWADASVGAWKRAGLMPGNKVLDLGCGPGHATFDLAQLITSSGEIYAMDESDQFLSSLKSQAELRKIKNIHVKQADAETIQDQFTKNSLDGVYCRWVLCWLLNPKKAIQGVHQILKPGGRFIIHDYFNWKTMTSAPRSPDTEKMVASAVKSFEARHGNVDLAAEIPKMLREAGFEITHFELHQRVARGGGKDATLAWPLTWWRTYAPKLVDQGFLEKSVWEKAKKDLADLEKNPDRFFFCPPVFEFIATKK